MTNYTTFPYDDNLEEVSPGGGDAREGGGPPPGRSAVLITAHNSSFSSKTDFWIGGSKVKVKLSNEQLEQVGGGIRGKITGFSKGSRRRLMRKLAEVSRDALPLWVGLTFPDEFYNYKNDRKAVRSCLRRLEYKFRRKFPDGAFIWRSEWKDRLSGKYVGQLFPHFHLLVYGVRKNEFEAWLFRAWWDSCGRLSVDHLARGTYVEQLKTPKQVNCYISKYMAKVCEPGYDIGRVWGVVQVHNIPWVKAVSIMLTRKEAVQLARYMRRFAHIRGRDYKSLTVLLDAEIWFRNLDRLLYPF